MPFGDFAKRVAQVGSSTHLRGRIPLCALSSAPTSQPKAQPSILIRPHPAYTLRHDPDSPNPPTPQRPPQARPTTPMTPAPRPTIRVLPERIVNRIAAA